jgi:predicted phosphodiesterase
MICIEKRLDYTYGDIFKIKPIADVHLGNKFCDLKAFKAYIEDFDDKTYFIGIGDLIDAVIASDAKRYRKSSDATEGDDILGQQIQDLTALLKPIADRIIVLGDGNHEQTIVSRCSLNPVKMICDSLNIPYGGYTYFLTLRFRENDGRGRTVTIKASHGWGGGSRTEGADMTKFCRDAGRYDSDVFLYGHTHKLQYYSIPVIGSDGKKLVARNRLVAICGTWLKTLSSGTDSTYSERSGYAPCHIGSPTINIELKMATNIHAS